MAGLFVKLDVNFPDDEKIIDASLAASGLYCQALCIAKRMVDTDGVLPRSQLYRLGADDDLIGECIDLGLFSEEGERHVRIAAWLKRNKSGEEVDAAHDGAYAAHVRWHEQRGQTKEGCEFCFTANPQVNAGSCDADAGGNATAMPETEVETETEPEAEPSLGSSQSDQVPIELRPDWQHPVVKAAALKRTDAPREDPVPSSEPPPSEAARAALAQHGIRVPGRAAS